MKETDQWLEGYIQALKDYAWWKDGQQYVGSCGTTLESAIERMKQERRLDSADQEA